MRSLAMVLFLFPAFLQAQPQYGNWYFGFGAGITFTGGTPTALAGNPFTTDEGCATISDASGQLLFTTNGEVIYDRNGDPMPHATALAGHYSAAQSALIVPFVGDPDRYYVFTVPSEVGLFGGPWSGLAYSVVNMTLNGGLGDVEMPQLNVHLVDQTTEHLTAVRHANGRDAWLVAHGWNSDVYHVYLVTCDGVHGPFDSHAGRAIQLDPDNTVLAAIGCTDISAQGDRIATTWTDYAQPLGGTANLDILAFDNTTGAVGAGLSVTHAADATHDLRGYGVAFSPNGSRLYWSENGLLAGGGYSGLLQFDLTAADIAASEQTIAVVNDAFGTLQIGPDGRLYCARLNGTTHISRVNVPDALGVLCGFDEPGVDIAPAISTWGLANDWDSYPEAAPLEPLSLSDTTLCGGGPFLADATYDRPYETPTYVWSTGATTPAISITEPGTYHVQVELRCDTLDAAFDVSFGDLRVDLGDDRTLCLGDSLALTATTSATHLFWSTGDTARTAMVGEEGDVWLTVFDDEGCSGSDTVFVDVTDCTCPVYVPNTFTPNTDDINDGFTARSDCDFRRFKLTVFDRWGHELFTSEDPLHAWAGDGAPIGVYAWTLDYAWTDGVVDHTATRTGHITLVR